MDIVIVAQYLRNIENFEGNNSRFVYLAKMLAETNSVEIVTSNFNHGTKKHFEKTDIISSVKITICEEPGYPQNVCLTRFSSHKKLSKNILSYLNGRRKPDVLYVAIPSLAVAEICANYCRENGIKFIVDIQDLWPEAYKMVFNIPLISDICFYPMRRQANKVYALANEIVAVSRTYAKRGMQVNKKCQNPIIAYLGTEKETFDRYAKIESRDSDEIVVSYIGSLSASYDLETVIDAIAIIKDNIRFIVMGDGAYKERFEKYAAEKGIKFEFTGRLEYPEMVRRLVNSDIAVNPIHKGSAGSIINKVNDYAMAGLPVVNTQESAEYRALLDEYNAGINCECESVQSVYEALQRLINDSELRKEIGRNSRKLGEEQIDRAKSYKKIVSAIVGEKI